MGINYLHLYVIGNSMCYILRRRRDYILSPEREMQLNRHNYVYF